MCLEFRLSRWFWVLRAATKPEQRALFVRVYLDLLTERARGHATVPQDWGDALQACLEKAEARERDLYLADLAEVLGRPAERRPPPVPRDEIDGVVAHGRLDQLIALAADRQARLRGEHIQSLAARALTLARYGDRRLAEALLGREGLRLEAAPLFLEANAEQRAAILAAAQRAVLGARARDRRASTRRRRSGSNTPPSPATSASSPRRSPPRSAPTRRSPSASPPIPPASRLRWRCSRSARRATSPCGS